MDSCWSAYYFWSRQASAESRSFRSPVSSTTPPTSSQHGHPPGSTNPRRVGAKHWRQDGRRRNTMRNSRTGPGPQPAVVGRHGAFLLPATIRLGFLRLHRLRTWHVPCYHGYCSPRVSPRSVFSLTALPVQLQDAAPSVGLGGFFQGQWFAERWPVEAGTFALGSSRLRCSSFTLS